MHNIIHTYVHTHTHTHTHKNLHIHLKQMGEISLDSPDKTDPSSEQQQQQPNLGLVGAGIFNLNKVTEGFTSVTQNVKQLPISQRVGEVSVTFVS